MEPEIAIHAAPLQQGVGWHSAHLTGYDIVLIQSCSCAMIQHDLDSQSC